MALQLYKIATIEVGSSGSTTIDFTSIPQGYTDLKIVYSLRGTTENTSYVFITFNGLTTNLSSKNLNGNPAVGASALSYTNASDFRDIAGQNPYTYSANIFNNAELYIPNYTASNSKSISVDSVTENNSTNAYVGLNVALWNNSAAISRVTLRAGTTDTFAQYSTATLYGIL